MCLSSLTLNGGNPPASARLEEPREGPEAPAGFTKERAQRQKLQKAAQEFEAILLSSWWEAMGKSFPASSESGRESGLDMMQDLSRQAMSVAIAACGGLGIARVLIRQLERSLPGTGWESGK